MFPKCLIVLLLLFPLLLLGQEDQAYEQDFESDKLSYNLGYFGANIWNPGLNFRAERLIREKIKVKKRKNGKLKTKHILLNGNVGFFWNPQTHVGVFTNYGFLFRKITHNNFKTNLGLNPLGYYRAFTTETYFVTDDGEVKNKVLGGRNYYALNLIFGIGKEKEKREWFLNYHLLLINNYNLSALPQFNIEYGYKF